ncbi:putative reverse transcriptase zinc-binding domain-containing protein [Helianthus debilis subsp. tardiflorus]
MKSVIDASNADEEIEVWDWNPLVPIKLNTFGWRLLLNRLPTADVLRKRGILIGPSMFPLCNTASESADHIFASCYVALVIWNAVSRWCGLDPINVSSVRDIFEIHRSAAGSSYKRQVIHAIITTPCWTLWKTRNNIILNNGSFKVDGNKGEVKSCSFLWVKHRAKRINVEWNRWISFDM